MSSLSTIDTCIVIIYILCIFSVGLYAFCDNKKVSSNAYFLASRNVCWLSVAATLFSSNIGAEHFVGLAGTAASSGIAVGAFEWTAPFMLWILGYFLSDLYISCGIITTPEYLEKRYNQKVRIYNAFMTLFIYVFVVISTTLYAGSVILETVIGWSLYTSSLSLIIATGVYVTLGGLKAIVWTENIQCIVLLIGGLIVMIFSLIKVGGLSSLSLFYSDMSSDNMHMFRSYKDEEWPWPGIVFGIFCNSYYYWNGQHLIVQRILAAKSPLHARLGCNMTSLLKLLPVFIMVIPGMCAIKLFPNEFANGTSNEYDRAYPLLVINILPNGLIGIVIASMLSALMSSLAAVYNSAATIIVNDFYKLYNPNVSDEKSVRIGRIGACLFVVFSVLWLPNIQNNSSELFIYAQQVISYVNPPLGVVYFFGQFWTRANVYGAYTALCIGFLFGIPRFMLGIVLENKYCQNVFCQSNYLYFAIFLFIACSIGMIVVSLITDPPKDVNINGMTYWTIRHNDDKYELNEVSLSKITQNKQNEAILPLIEPISQQSSDSNKCCKYILDFLRLESDEKNKNWIRMANILFVIGFIATISMWIWFR